MPDRDWTPSDQLVVNFHRAARTVFGGAPASARAYPAEGVEEVPLTRSRRHHAVGLMRVDHAGEVAAQALYHGQSLTASDAGVRASMEQAAQEENDHLRWCEQRLAELDGRTSVLNAVWYAGAFALGLVAGAAGDKWSLGFLVETERQVERHLDEHLEGLPDDDARSRAILAQMRDDEIHHGTVAQAAGATELARPLKKLMGLGSKVMTRAAYWL